MKSAGTLYAMYPPHSTLRPVAINISDDKNSKIMPIMLIMLIMLMLIIIIIMEMSLL